MSRPWGVSVLVCVLDEVGTPFYSVAKDRGKAASTAAEFAPTLQQEASR